MILKVERNIKMRENRRKELYNVRIHFSPTCCQKCERQWNVVVMIYCQHNWIFRRQKKLLVFIV